MRRLADIPPLTTGVPYDVWMRQHNPPVLTPSELIRLWEAKSGQQSTAECQRGFIRDARFGLGSEMVIQGTNRSKSRGFRRAAAERSS